MKSLYRFSSPDLNLLLVTRSYALTFDYLLIKRESVSRSLNLSAQKSEQKPGSVDPL